jgi:ROK family
LQVYGEIGRWLGVALDKYIALLEPEVLVLGGGILTANEALFDQLRTALLAQSSQTGETLKIVPACLGEDAVLIGAALPLFSTEASLQANKFVEPEQSVQKKQQKRQPRIALHHPDDVTGDEIGLSASLLADALQSPKLHQGNV